MGGLGRDLEGTQEKVSIRAIQACGSFQPLPSPGLPPTYPAVGWVLLGFSGSIRLLWPGWAE